MDSLAFFQPAVAEPVAVLNLGAVRPSSSDDTLLRVVNHSDIYQAKDVTVSVDSGDVVELWLSTDGDNFFTSIHVGDIQPGGLSPSFWLRRVTPNDAANGTHNAAISAAPAAWVSPVDTSTSPNVALDTEN